MAFVVEDGTGLATATSLVTTEDYDAYLVENGYEADARPADPDKRTSAIVSSRAFCRKHETTLRSCRRNNVQALCYPRQEYEDGLGRTVLESAIPIEIQHAVFEYMRRHANGEDLTPDVQQDMQVTGRTDATTEGWARTIHYSPGGKVDSRGKPLTGITIVKELIRPHVQYSVTTQKTLLRR